MNSKIVSTILATAGVAVGVIGVTMGGAASSTPADCPTVPSMNAPASGAANGAGAAVPATAVPGTENATPAANTPSGTEGNGAGNGNGSGAEGNGGGLVSVGTGGNGNGSLIDVNANPPSGATTPTLPSGGTGGLGGLAIDLDAHANPNQSNHPLVTVNGSVDNR